MNKYKIVSKGSIGSFLKFSFVVSMAVLLVNSTAIAATTANFGDSSGEVPDYSTTVSLDTYSGTETLQSAKVTITLLVWDAVYELDNDSSSSTDVDIDMALGVDATAFGTTYSDTGVLLDTTVSLAANNGDSKRSLDTDTIGGSDYDSQTIGTQATPVEISVSWTVTGSDLNNYLSSVSGSTFDLAIDVDWISSIVGSTHYSVLAPLFTGTAKVEYEYVPEPATMAMFGIGGLLAARRRKSNS